MHFCAMSWCIKCCKHFFSSSRLLQRATKKFHFPSNLIIMQTYLLLLYDCNLYDFRLSRLARLLLFNVRCFIAKCSPFSRMNWRLLMGKKRKEKWIMGTWRRRIRPDGISLAVCGKFCCIASETTYAINVALFAFTQCYKSLFNYSQMTQLIARIAVPKLIK